RCRHSRDLHSFPTRRSSDLMLLTPTYHVMEMYKVHQDATLLPMEIDSEDYIVGGEKLPAISASASKDKNGVTHISLVNIDGSKAHDVSVAIDGAKYKNVAGRILTSKNIQDHNTFDNPEKVKPTAFKGAKLKGNTLDVKLPPFSVVVLELK